MALGLGRQPGAVHLFRGLISLLMLAGHDLGDRMAMANRRWYLAFTRASKAS
jgi:hypothetical protein